MDREAHPVAVAAVPGPEAQPRDPAQTAAQRPVLPRGDLVMHLDALRAYLEAGGDADAVPAERGGFGFFFCPPNVSGVEKCLMYGYWCCGAVMLCTAALQYECFNGNPDRLTLLMFAVLLGQVEAVKTLLEAGADPLVRNARDEDALAFTARVLEIDYVRANSELARNVGVAQGHVRRVVEAAQSQEKATADRARDAEEKRRFAELESKQQAAIQSALAGAPKRAPAVQKKGKYAFFISHMKAEAGLVASLFFQVLSYEFGLAKDDVFLDTENAQDLREIKAAVVASDCVVVLLTKSYVSRPWCLIELYEAVKSDAVIKPVLVQGGGYSFEDSLALLNRPDVEAALDAVNPGAFHALQREGYDPVEVFKTVGANLPYLLARPFDPNATLSVKKAQVADALGLSRE